MLRFPTGSSYFSSTKPYKSIPSSCYNLTKIKFRAPIGHPVVAVRCYKFIDDAKKVEFTATAGDALHLIMKRSLSYSKLSLKLMYAR